MDVASRTVCIAKLANATVKKVKQQIKCSNLQFFYGLWPELLFLFIVHGHRQRSFRLSLCHFFKLHYYKMFYVYTSNARLVLSVRFFQN